MNDPPTRKRAQLTSLENEEEERFIGQVDRLEYKWQKAEMALTVA